MFYQAMLVNNCLILHIAGIFSDALRICAKPLFNAVFCLSLTLEFWIPPLQKFKIDSCKYFNGNANRMHGCCSQLGFVTEVSLGYVHYFVDFIYFFQFTACYFVVHRITLIYVVCSKSIRTDHST